MELTLTNAPAPESTGILDRIRRLFGGEPNDGRLGSAVNAARALELVKDGASLLDVRESGEWKSGHAPRALHIPLGQIDQAARRLKKDRPVVVVCTSGMRSRTAAKHLRGLGFEAASLSGGMPAWHRAGGEVK